MWSQNTLPALMGAFFINSAVGYVCPPLGPAYPEPKVPSKSKSIEKANLALKKSLDNFTAPFQASAISVGVQSIYEDGPLFEYHFTPEMRDNRSVSAVDGDTAYRIASITKVFSVLTAMRSSDIEMDAPITQYLPELKDLSVPDRYEEDAIEPIEWEKITVESLGNYLSGLGRDTATDLAIFPANWTDLGLPEVDPRDAPTCSGYPGTEPCTAKDILKSVSNKPAVYRPYTTPLYSNVGFALLGMVIEAATGKTYEEAVVDLVATPYGLNSTSFETPERGFVPYKEPTWGTSLGAHAAGAGLFSTTNDLLAFGSKILKDGSESWLKPQTFSSSQGISSGEPWEIFTTRELSPSGRLMSVYAKAGNLGLFHNNFVLVPDLGIVVTILSGGAEINSASLYIRELMTSRVLRGILPALEKAAKEEAIDNFAGTYTDADSESQLVLCEDKEVGLVMKNLTMRGVDVLANFSKYSMMSSSDAEPVSATARIFPTNIKSDEHYSWRAVYDTMTKEERAELDEQIFYPDGSCWTWASALDSTSYNNRGLDDFVFTMSSGEATHVRSRAFGLTLTRKDE